MTDALRVLAVLRAAGPRGVTAGHMAWCLSWPIARVEAALAELVRDGLAWYDAARAVYISLVTGGGRG